MFNATYFTYDGVFSGTYGLIMADFDDSSVVETAAFSPVLNTTKSVSVNRFYHNGITYEGAPQHQITVVSETEIPAFIRREVLSWLVGRNKFKKLQIHQADLEGYYYNCVFTDVEIIYINGRCHGFRLMANFDSPYAYGNPTTCELKSGTNVVKILNNSDIVDGYVYPTVSFTVSGICNGDAQAVAWVESQNALATRNQDGTITPLNSYNVCIINKTDDTNRRFIFAGLRANESITVDNEVKHISSSVGGEKLSNFNKNWLRLRPGYNELLVDINGAGTITCPHYAMIGF